MDLVRILCQDVEVWIEFYSLLYDMLPYHSFCEEVHYYIFFGTPLFGVNEAKQGNNTL
jgi:hypothetical protein